MISRKAIEWYKEVVGLEEHSPMDPNQSRDVYQKDTVGPEDRRIGGLLFARRKFRPTGYQSKRIE